MDESFAETKRELYELMQRMRHDRITPPTPEGVTPSEARTMMTVAMLEEHGEPIRPGRVAELSHTTPSALSQTFKALEEKGLIERHRSGDDYRAVTVNLTAEGRRMRDEHMEQVMAFVGEEDMAHLVRILKRVVAFHDLTHTSDGSAPCPFGAASPVPRDPEGGDAPCA